MYNFKNKVALVTGASSGMGKEIAFAKAGAKVAINARRENKGNEVVAEIEKLGGEAYFQVCDISNEDDINSFIENTVKKFGRLDFAFNNAGTEGKGGMTADESYENYENVFSINVAGVLFSMKHQIQAMLKNEGGAGGAIVNNSSVLGLRGMAGTSVYTASKHAVVGLTKCTALEYSAQGIRINSVCPAVIETEMYTRFSGGDQDTIDYLNNMHPIGRIGKANEVSNTVLWLCSNQASFVSGINMPVDGATTAK